jgi:hypothetical protein
VFLGCSTRVDLAETSPDYNKRCGLGLVLIARAEASVMTTIDRPIRFESGASINLDDLTVSELSRLASVLVLLNAPGPIQPLLED